MTTPDLPEPEKPVKTRYAPDMAFPPYRYVPLGRHPHPTMDKGGHMKERTLRLPDEAPSELAWMTNTIWLYGVDLFNAGYFWEATEIWEKLWSRMDKAAPPAVFLQGLMMASGGILKAHCREIDGVRAFWEQADGRLGQCAQVAKTLWGLKTKTVHKDFAKFYRPYTKNGAVPVVDKTVPRLKLDW